MTSISQEFHRYLAVPLAELKAAGISTTALIRCGSIRTANVRFGRERGLAPYFEFAGDGQFCWLIGAYEVDYLIDVVAWRPDKPERFSRLTRKAWGIGIDRALSPNRISDNPDRLPPARVYRTPLSWLQGGADGIVILDPERARAELWHVDQLAAADQHHGHQLKQLMKRPAWSGQVLIPKQVAA